MPNSIQSTDNTLNIYANPFVPKNKSLMKCIGPYILTKLICSTCITTVKRTAKCKYL